MCQTLFKCFICNGILKTILWGEFYISDNKTKTQRISISWEGQTARKWWNKSTLSSPNLGSIVFTTICYTAVQSCERINSIKIHKLSSRRIHSQYVRLLPKLSHASLAPGRLLIIFPKTSFNPHTVISSLTTSLSMALRSNSGMLEILSHRTPSWDWFFNISSMIYMDRTENKLLKLTDDTCC